MAGQFSKFRKFTTPVRLMGGLVLALSTAFSGAGAPAVQAQPVTDFRLPPATSSPTAPVVGPTDSDHPVAAPTVAPTAAPTATPTLAIPVTPATPAARPTPQQTPAARRDPQATRAPSTATATSAPAPTPTALVSPAPAPMLTPPTGAQADGTETPAPPPPASLTATGGMAWWWLIPALLAGAVLGAMLLRRRAQHDPAPAEPLAEQAEFQPNTEPAPAPAVPAPQAVEANAAALFDLTLVDIALEPVRLSVSLVNATLQYRLRLDNRSTATVGPIALALDMISAHASLSEDSQLGRDGTMIELRHELPALAPGENAEAIGELRLPLSAVTPIRSGNAVLLVPLIRVRMAAGDVALSRAMVVGEPPIQPGGPLRPFRLDQGPRVFTTIIQRPLAA